MSSVYTQVVQAGDAVPKKRLDVRVPAELVPKLRALADARKVSVNHMVVQLIEAHLQAADKFNAPVPRKPFP